VKLSITICHDAECRVLFIVMLNVIMVSVIMLIVIMQSAVSPKIHRELQGQHGNKMKSEKN